MQGRPPDAGDPASCGEGPSEWYFDVVNKVMWFVAILRQHGANQHVQDPSETGLVLGNLKIAEDRVLSASAVLKSQERCEERGFVDGVRSQRPIPGATWASCRTPSSTLMPSCRWRT